MLKIENLKVTVGSTEILKGLNLTVNKGEVHAIMGPNGSGKSTLSHVIAGKEGYNVTEGDISFRNESIVDKLPEEISWSGVFLAFQYPMEIPGVNNVYMLREALNSQRRHRKQKELNASEFLKFVKEKVKSIGLNEKLLSRPVNSGFSGVKRKETKYFK